MSSEFFHRVIRIAARFRQKDVPRGVAVLVVFAAPIVCAEDACSDASSW